MTLLNEFLKMISMRADDNDDLHAILRDFLEPDPNDKKIHGGAVVRTVSLPINKIKCTNTPIQRERENEMNVIKIFCQLSC